MTAASQSPKTIIDKVWDAHVILDQGDEALLWVDRHLVHEGSHHGFAQIADTKSSVARPDLTFAFADHYIATRPGGPADKNVMVERLANNARTHGITLFGAGDAAQGIAHVAATELGLSLPGTLIVCGDSHTSTHGAFGALAFGIGASEVAHVLQTQTIWQTRPKRMRITLTGELPFGAYAKDMVVHLIEELGTDYAVGHAVEYCGSAVENLSIEARMTLCNMSIEFGSRFGLIAPDAVTIDYLKRCSLAPAGEAFERAAEQWRALASDADAIFDHETTLDVSNVAPTVTWGITPHQAAAITSRTPDPAEAADAAAAEAVTVALDYMGLAPRTPLTDIRIDRVFIGSCTNGRIEDLRIASQILKGRKARVPGMVSPGSSQVKKQAEDEGLDRIFVEAGLEWVGSGCSMCVGMNGDLLSEGERCASTTNRNFRGRQGKGARTHLVSPAMAAASAVTGHLADPREFLEEAGR